MAVLASVRALGSSSTYKYVVAPIAVIALAIGLEWGLSDPVIPPASAVEWSKSGYGPVSFAEAIDRTEVQIDLGKERVRNGPEQWLRQESLARALMARSRLSPTYDELAEATEILDKANRLAPTNSGPLLSTAVLAMMTHRLASADHALNLISKSAVPPADDERSEVIALSGDVRFFRGDFAGARELYNEASGLAGGAGLAYRFARLAKSNGDFDQAISFFKASEVGRPPPFQHANTAMQIGAVELARGNYAAARSWFVEADKHFPGYWLLEAHLAQSKALDGNIGAAIGDMRRIANQTHSAEIMDGLAMMLRIQGQSPESRYWADKAGLVWQRRLKQLPEAAFGHALEHELVFGSPDRALDLAKRNLQARPYGESRILMASALLMNGRTADAVSQLAIAEKSGWRSAPMYALRAQAYELLGKQSKAEEARQAAIKLNPRIFDAETALVWFSHG